MIQFVAALLSLVSAQDDEIPVVFHNTSPVAAIEVVITDSFEKRTIKIDANRERTVAVEPGAKIQFRNPETGSLKSLPGGSAAIQFVKSHGRPWQAIAHRKPIIRNKASMRMIPIKAGRFQMGSRASAETIARRYSENASSFRDEHPVHTVQLTRGFYISATEVTQGQFEAFVDETNYRTDAERDGKGGGGFNPNANETLYDGDRSTWRDSGGPLLPVIHVSWKDAKAFCSWLSKAENATYRLPTEAEWEYCARAGTTTDFFVGDDPEMLYSVANVPDAAYLKEVEKLSYRSIRSSDGFAFRAPAGFLGANNFGLHDMHGNVWEWCEDVYSATAYRRGSVVNPLIRTGSNTRVIRGGCFM